MPELPEVETTRRGLAPHLVNRSIVDVICRVPKLRLPLDPFLPRLLSGQTVLTLERRGKYLLLGCNDGTLLIHLGMTGHLRIFAANTPPDKYDHFELTMDDGRLLRLSDPRKFGIVTWISGDPHAHPLLYGLGPEPLENDFTGDYLHQQTRRRQSAIKLVLMDNRVVVGVGNIYANESCFLMGINPATPARELTKTACARAAAMVREVLQEAIARGVATLNDYVDSSGTPTYFRLQPAVYGREGEPCPTCSSAIRRSLLAGRSTYWCPTCQL